MKIVKTHLILALCAWVSLYSNTSFGMERIRDNTTNHNKSMSLMKTMNVAFNDDMGITKNKTVIDEYAKSIKGYYSEIPDSELLELSEIYYNYSRYDHRKKEIAKRRIQEIKSILRSDEENVKTLLDEILSAKNKNKISSLPVPMINHVSQYYKRFEELPKKVQSEIATFTISQGSEMSYQLSSTGQKFMENSASFADKGSIKAVNKAGTKPKLPSVLPKNASNLNNAPMPMPNLNNMQTDRTKSNQFQQINNIYAQEQEKKKEKENDDLLPAPSFHSKNLQYDKYQ